MFLRVIYQETANPYTESRICHNSPHLTTLALRITRIKKYQRIHCHLHYFTTLASTAIPSHQNAPPYYPPNDHKPHSAGPTSKLSKQKFTTMIRFRLEFLMINIELKLNKPKNVD